MGVQDRALKLYPTSNTASLYMLTVVQETNCFTQVEHCSLNRLLHIC